MGEKGGDKVNTCSNCGNKHPLGFGFTCVSVDGVHPPHTCKNWKPLKVISLTIPELPESLNKILNWHWTKRKQYKDRCHMLVKSEINRQGLTKFKGCVIIKYRFCFDNHHKRDADNFLAGCKYFQDELKENLLEDDNMDIIKGLEFDYEIGKERKTIITIRSCK